MSFISLMLLSSKFTLSTCSEILDWTFRAFCLSCPHTFKLRVLDTAGNSASWFWLLRFWFSSCSRWTVRGYRRPRLHPWVGNILWRRKWQPTPVFLPGELTDRRAWRAKVHEQSSAMWMFEDIWWHSVLARYSEHSPWTNSQPHPRPSNLPFRLCVRGC